MSLTSNCSDFSSSVQDAAGWVELNATADGLTAAPIPAGQEVLIVIGEGLDKERIETVLRN